MAKTKKDEPMKLNITEICLTFLQRNRFYAVILSKLVKIPTNRIATAGVGFNKHGKLTLYYNEDFLFNLPLEKAQAVLEHEVLHVFFRHLTRHPKEGTASSAHMDDIKNIGCDIAINQYIPTMPNKQDCIDNFMRQLDSDIPPELRKKIETDMNKSVVGAHTPELYGFDREKSADHYIEELKKKFTQPPECPTCGAPTPNQNQGQGQQQQQQGQGKGKKQTQQQQGQGQGQGQQQAGQGQGQGQQQAGQGQGQSGHQCPSCGQQPGQGKGQAGKGQTLGSPIDSHDLWDKVIDEESGTITDVEDLDFDPEYETVSIVQKAIKECKDFGNLPSFVRREIEELQKPVNRYNWKHELRVFVNSMLSVAKRLSQKRVNRRFANQSYILPGKKKSRRPSILVARDTSGSVFDDETQREFENEILNISKFATIHVCDCDTIIHQTYEVKKASDFKDYKGGGGTSFVPVFKKAQELGVDGIIYLTDTEGTFPDKEDIGKLATKTIWCTIDQEKVDVPFGKHVNIPSGR